MDADIEHVVEYHVETMVESRRRTWAGLTLIAEKLTPRSRRDCFGLRVVSYAKGGTCNHLYRIDGRIWTTSGQFAAA